jgi:hypothetical protein
MKHDVEESRAYAEHLLSEHRRVHGLLNRIDQQWSLTSGAPRPRLVISNLREGFDELRRELVKHFAEEEEGGVLEEAVARCPGLGREEMRLEEEHSALLGELDRIITGMQTAMEVGLIPRELNQTLRLFVQRLQSHEADENRLLERGFRIEIY